MIKCPGCGEENPPKFRLCGYCGTALSAAPAPPVLPVRELRKTVTIVFSDLKDSTALGESIDTEALHEVKERYFSTMAAEIKRHGGKIEKYIGDAIMAVFGLPRANEDDALRAVRAAQGMRRALEELNDGLRQRYGVSLANRTGVNTGEVVANDDPTADQKLATGDAVNVAARLEQAAPVNEIYIGETTWRLVRDAVEAEAVEPLALKGKTERIPAYRLISASGQDGNVRRIDTPLAGRDAELNVLVDAWNEVRTERVVRLVTVVGDAGLGKSRLIHELIHRHAERATVLRGRCLPYGDGITFWPLVEMASAMLRTDQAPDKVTSRLVSLTGDEEVARRLASVIGLSQDAYPLHEINWAARRFLEHLATLQPVIVFVDDIHWAEPAFLELLEHVLDAAKDAPIFLLATSRHDLFEERPTWPDRDSAARLVLRPLNSAAAASVVKHLLGSASLPPSVVARIVAAAEGNPLYVEQMLSMLIDSRAVQHDDEAASLAGLAGMTAEEQAGDEIVVPPTIRALLEARLDKLGREERATVEPAAVVGVTFEQPAVQSLTPDAVRPAVDRHLQTLRRKQFIDVAESRDAEAMFRFHHHLIRDTVYNGMLKRARANLHRAFVRWADKENAERDRGVELEEILGYHLEQAHRYLSELGPLDAEGLALGADAATRLSNAAKRAFGRGDMHAAANLDQRAVALLPESSPQRLALLPELGEILIELGNFGEARRVLTEAEGQAEKVGDRRIAASAHLLRLRIKLFSGEPGDSAAEVLRIADEAIPLFQRESAHPELARAWRLIGLVHGIAARYGQSTDAVSQSMLHARAANDQRLIARNAAGLSSSTLLGPTPVGEAIALCEKMVADGLTDRQAESKILCTLAQLRAMRGDFDEARKLYRRGRSLLRELGKGLMAAGTGIDLLLVELLAGDLAGAERDVMPDYLFLESAGETYRRSTLAALLSRVVRDQGRDADAMRYSEVAEQLSGDDDIDSLALWRSIRAPILARAGRHDEAQSLARSAVELSRLTDALQMQGETMSELAAVLAIGGRRQEARETIVEAIRLFEAKGASVAASQAHAWAATID